MTKKHRARLDHQLDRLVAVLPADIAAAAMADFGVLTTRIPPQHRASAQRLRSVVARIANDNC